MFGWLEWLGWGKKSDGGEHSLEEAVKMVRALNASLAMMHDRYEEERRSRAIDIAALVAHCGGVVDMSAEVLDTVVATEGRWSVEVEKRESRILLTLVSPLEAAPGDESCDNHAD
jgi:hypothetical protein